MKTITTVEEAKAFPVGAVALDNDGKVLQVVDNKADWDDEELAELLATRGPLTLIYPLVFDAADVDRAADALMTVTACYPTRDEDGDLWCGIHDDQQWFGDREFPCQSSQTERARAVLGAVGSVE